MKNAIIKNTLILSIGLFISKILGAVYRVALTRVLGVAGISLYQLVFPVYSLMVVLSSAGIPLAVSKIVSTSTKDKQFKIAKYAIYALLISSLLFALSMIALSRVFSTFQHCEKLYLCYILLSPSIVFIAVVSVIRGYFQGINYFVPTAVSQTIEQIVKVSFGLILSYHLSKYGIYLGVIGAVISIVLSELFSLIYIVILFQLKTKKIQVTEKENEKKEIYLTLYKQALPFILTSLIWPLSSFIDSVLVVNLLSINFPSNISIFLYGIQTGIVGTIINLPNVATSALVGVIIPALSKNYSKDKNINKQQINEVIKIMLIYLVPFFLMCLFFAEPIISVLYGNKISGNGFSGAKIACQLLRINSVSVIFFSFLELFIAMLQSFNRRYITILNNFIGIIIKLVLEVIFIMSPEINIFGFAFACVVSSVVAMMLNYNQIMKLSNIQIEFIYFGKVIISSSFMIAIIAVLNILKYSNVTFILYCFIGLFVYLSILKLLNIENHFETIKLKINKKL